MASKDKKNKKLTSREQHSARIIREKSAKKKRQLWIKRLQYGCMAVAVIIAGGTGFWIWKYSLVSYAYNAVVSSAYQLTARAGFAFDVLYLEGRDRTPVAEINKAVNLEKGTPILQVSLADMRQRLETISSIKSAAVERELPGRLNITIVERKPVAIWQHQGKYTLVDDNGVAMPDLSVAEHPHLPLIVGSDAPPHVGEVIQMLQSQQQLALRFKAAVRISNRRWNIRLADDTEIKLPEKGPMAAWDKLAQIHEKQALLDRAAQVIDLRVAGRLFITLPAEQAPTKASRAKET